MTKRRDLMAMAEKFAVLLISEATNGKIGGVRDPLQPPNKIDFKDRARFLDTLTKLIREKNTKDGEEDNSGMANFKELLNGTEFSGESSSRSDTSSSASSKPSGNDDSDDEDLVDYGA